MKIFSMEDELFHADGRTDKWTDMTKQNVDFLSFVNIPKMVDK